MKTIISILLLFSIIKCTPKTVENKTSNSQENLWQKVDIKDWKNVPAINNRIANEMDVENGIAVYYIENTNTEEHKAYKINLPKLAYWNDVETKTRELVIVIQIEETPKGIIVGYRNLNGGNGAGLLHEFDFLNNEETKKVIE
jgi:desulfoferrodoxin (superoxide reductase-like protein)